MLMSSIRLCHFLHFKAPEWFLVCWQIALYSYMYLTWLSSRKYGTVWYHPASSKLWNLTTFSFVNFQGKLTGTSCDLLVCEASFFSLLCAWCEVQILRQHIFHRKFSEHVSIVLSLDLFLTTSPFSPSLFFHTHFVPIGLHPGGKSTNSQT
jgi:hypothetical protein